MASVLKGYRVFNAVSQFPQCVCFPNGYFAKKTGNFSNVRVVSCVLISS